MGSVAAAAFLLELGLRGAGLGGWSLNVPDEAAGYVPRPGLETTRLGRRISHNAAGQRAAPVPDAAMPQRRVLVIGDSVIYGGFLDDAETATGLLQERLGEAVWVGAIAAGSWSPANQLGYLRRRGVYGADTAALVLNADDLRRGESVAPRRGLLPLDRPVLAIEEFWTRILKPRLLSRPADGLAPLRPEAVGPARTLLRFLADRGVATVLMFHPGAAPEAGGHQARARDLLAALAGAEGVPFVDLGPHYAARGGLALYADRIHLTAEGHRALAAALEQALRTAGR